MPVIEAQDIVNAIIQDTQSQTTNRTALYDYVDRVHQRILRESQWRFLLSDPQYFVTMPGVANYSLVSGSPPAGYFQTPLNLTDFNNVAPGTVFNATSWQRIEEDPDTNTTQSPIIFRDGSLRSGAPRTYQAPISNPGTMILKPAPDGQNLYYPIPETPIVGQSTLTGCLLPDRFYYGVVTFVDAFGGESLPCTIPFTIAVLQGNVCVVDSPLGLIGGETGNQMTYVAWNLYMGVTPGNYFRQNVTPILLGTNWTEAITGLNVGHLQVPSLVYLPPASSKSFLAIHSSGFLTVTTGSQNVVPSFWAIQDPNGATWQVTVNPVTNILETIPTGPLPTNVNVIGAILLTDIENLNTWKITVDISGVLHSTIYSTPPSTAALNSQPPQTSTIQPLNAYVIQFRYYKARNQIVNPTDVLQVPYAYKDIVIAGVNYLVSLYLDERGNREPSAKTNIFFRDFTQGLAQIRRDLRINYRKTDFIAPDSSTQYVVANQQGIPTMGW